GDKNVVRRLMLESARLMNVTIVTDVFHSFNPHGVSGVVVIAESHAAIHTWPERGIASVDIFSCGANINPSAALDFLKIEFGAGRKSVMVIRRGLPEGAAAEHVVTKE
ncbi:MAG: adenosylmethionine decarboxylase, partial [Nitrospinae bacterium]|nr:adenosylmethionine decarboxylase [Nitrospinota bacterium]